MEYVLNLTCTYLLLTCVCVVLSLSCWVYSGFDEIMVRIMVRKRSRIRIGFGMAAWALIFGVLWPLSLPYAAWIGMDRVVKMMEASSARRPNVRWTAFLASVCVVSVLVLWAVARAV